MHRQRAVRTPPSSRRGRKTASGNYPLQSAIEHANEDVRTGLRLVQPISLGLFGDKEAEVVDPAHGYPVFLYYITLKGYFGEIMAGLIALK